MQKLYSLTAVETTDAIKISPNKSLTFGINGSGTVQAEVKLTDDANAEWFVAQVCADATLYNTEVGARWFRFNQTAASGTTVCEVTGGDA